MAISVEDLRVEGNEAGLSLDEREKAIVMGLILGLSDEQIGRGICYSGKHVKSLRGKIGARFRINVGEDGFMFAVAFYAQTLDPGEFTGVNLASIRLSQTRERIVDLMAQGYFERTIAEMLGVKNIRNHIDNIFGEYGVVNKYGAVAARVCQLREISKG